MADKIPKACDPFTEAMCCIECMALGAAAVAMPVGFLSHHCAETSSDDSSKGANVISVCVGLLCGYFCFLSTPATLNRRLPQPGKAYGAHMFGVHRNILCTLLVRHNLTSTACWWYVDALLCVGVCVRVCVCVNNSDPDILHKCVHGTFTQTGNDRRETSRLGCRRRRRDAAMRHVCSYVQTHNNP